MIIYKSYIKRRVTLDRFSPALAAFRQRSAVEMVLLPLIGGVVTRAALPLTISKVETWPSPEIMYSMIDKGSYTRP